MTNPKPILCIDWGTSSFRATLAKSGSGEILKKFHSDRGCKVVFQQIQEKQAEPLDFYIETLRDLLREASISPSDYAEIIISGMASSSIGMMELPYANLPFSLDGKSVVTETMEIEKLGKITLISGVADREDIMRGEETQLVGLNDHYDAKGSILIVPGTHSKHLVIKNGELVSFKTYLTGELFQVLCQHTMLSNSVSKSSWSAQYESVFLHGVEDSQSTNVLNNLFRIRARDILGKSQDRLQNYYYLSGLIIGIELITLQGMGEQKVFACDEKMQPLYKNAASHLGLVKTSFLKPGALANAYISGQLSILKHLS